MSASPRGFVLDVRQSFGNCPQYIQPRDFRTAPAGPRSPETLQRLDREGREAISGADTFFVASAARMDEEAFGVDISHRGGPPGFVRVDGDTLTIPDFKGNWDALQTVVEARPFVLNHNVETAPRLYRWVRPQARYERSLELIRRAKDAAPDLLTKSGFMVGLGETRDELFEVMRDLREHGCDIVTIGQYLRPSLQHLPVERYYDPSEYQAFRDYGAQLGFTHVEAGPLVRSSYHAEKQSAPHAEARPEIIPLTQVSRG